MNYLIQVGSANTASQSSTSMYVRSVSDYTVHGKGFNLSYVAGSSDGKSRALNHKTWHKRGINQA